MVNVVVDFVEVARSDVSVNVILNVYSNRVKAEISRGAMDVKRNVELVPDVRVYGVDAVDKTDDDDSGGCPMGSACPNEVQGSHVGNVHENSSD